MNTRTLLSAVLLLCVCTAATAQYSAKGKVVFLGRQRVLVNNASSFLDSGTKGRLVVAFTVDRAGKVLSAEAHKEGTTLNDSALCTVAAAIARSHQFDADTTAPEPQHGKIVWEFWTVDEKEGSQRPPPPPEPIDSSYVYDLISVQEQPQFPGGTGALSGYLGKEPKYPADAEAADVEGKVYVEFVVDRAGRIKNVKVVRGVHPSLDKEALRIVKAMPDWTPGKHGGKPVQTRFVLPINFKLK